MKTVNVNGRVTADVELKKGRNESQFVGFNLAVNHGFGETATTEFIQCIIFGDDAERFIKAGVKKGSHIIIVGKESIKEFETKYGPDKANSIVVFGWEFVSSGKPKEEEKPEQQ